MSAATCGIAVPQRVRARCGRPAYRCAHAGYTLNDSAPTASNRLGVKGTGQAGSIAAPQTIMNAVLDALSPLGIDQLDMPATPFLVWSAIQAARKSGNY